MMLHSANGCIGQPMKRGFGHPTTRPGRLLCSIMSHSDVRPPLHPRESIYTSASARRSIPSLYSLPHGGYIARAEGRSSHWHHTLGTRSAHSPACALELDSASRYARSCALVLCGLYPLSGSLAFETGSRPDRPLKESWDPSLS